MAWIAVDLDGKIYKYKDKPIMCTDCWMPGDNDNSDPVEIQMSEIIKIIGKKITWNDGPIQIE